MITIKEKFIGMANSVSGIASLLGSWQICHTICLGFVALLALIGITVKGLPFLFLNTFAVPLWTMAAILFTISFIMYLRKGCVAERVLLFNLGILIAAIPFETYQKYLLFLWITGGILVISSFVLYIKEKVIKERVIKMNREEYVMLGILIVAVIALLFSFSGFFSGILPGVGAAKLEIKQGSTEVKHFGPIETGTIEQGDASIALTPVEVLNNQIVFDMAINTHSVDLSAYDLKEITTLLYNGNTVKPSEAPQLSGHHNSGRLVFQTTAKANVFTVKIRGIPNVQERTFEWR